MHHQYLCTIGQEQMHMEFTQDYTVINVTRIITLTEGTDTTMNHIVEKGWSQMSKKTYELIDLIIDACDTLDQDWKKQKKGIMIQMI